MTVRSRASEIRGRQHFVVRGLLIGAVAGAGTGALIGAIGRREVWRRVKLDALAARVSATPLPHSRGLTVRWATGR